MICSLSSKKNSFEKSWILYCHQNWLGMVNFINIFNLTVLFPGKRKKNAFGTSHTPWCGMILQAIEYCLLDPNKLHFKFRCARCQFRKNERYAFAFFTFPCLVKVAFEQKWLLKKGVSLNLWLNTYSFYLLYDCKIIALIWIFLYCSIFLCYMLSARDMHQLLKFYNQKYTFVLETDYTELINDSNILLCLLNLRIFIKKLYIFRLFLTT